MLNILHEPFLKPTDKKIAKIITLATACFASFLDVLNLSAVNIAVPTIARDIDLTPSTLPWLMAAYSIAFAAFLLPAGKLGDIYGYRMVYLLGLSLFALTSLLNAVSPNQYALFVFRAIQGLAAACVIPTGIALIANICEDEDERRLGFSLFGSSGPIGLVIGIILGGVLSSSIGWRWIFYVSAICSLAMLILAGLFVSDSKNEKTEEKVDMVGFSLVTSGFILIIFALSDGQWHLARDPVTLIIGVLLIIAFLVWQTKTSQPLLHPSWWRRTNFAIAFILNFVNYGSFSGYIYVATLLFQDVFGYTALQTGLYYLPMGIAAFLACNAVGYLTPYMGSRLLVIIGTTIGAAANVGTLFYSTELGFWKLIFPMHLLMGIGQPLTYVAGQNAMLLSAPVHETGTVGAVYNTASQLGSAMGLAIVTAIINAVNAADSHATNAFGGYHAALYALVALEVFCMISGGLFIRDERKNASSNQKIELENGTGASTNSSTVTVQDHK
ncbi:hypothetical protein INT43_008284 [Umbelopsis isabellina]|uniref:Major facilitator superfamily (MFS) profile domain-containing protein n=1 Tax=Mortierella isabellina TaxID=91625 RepID=A0A8H7PCY1_MORIS|nr:hypothetical protein INT43_008284 [Umbelopsis isabellina]